MTVEFKPAEFEPKWAKQWVDRELYKAEDFGSKPKSYLLIEFPYPSGERLHVGHARSYSCLDVVARLRRMKGFNVLYPIGWDAFGLPAENYAIKTGIHPSITTAQNIANAKAQAQRWGLSFDWSREINTSEPSYYKWTQWIFIQLFKKGLAYKKEIAVNWCPSCKINLADEEVIDGKCERCGTGVERRMQSQWLLKITAYADRLLEDLKLVQYRDDIALQQVNWIGKKEGAKVQFTLKSEEFSIVADVFTTRIDTIFGVTFLVVAPEVAAEWLHQGWKPRKEVMTYIDTAVNTSEEDRKKTEKEKTGVLTDIVAINPANGADTPVYVADYVLKGVGTGVVMGVPAHDSRDMAFAKKHGIAIVKVLESGEELFEGEAPLINSGPYTGKQSEQARSEMIEQGLGELMTHYHLRDWVFSRQHYWGEPIPMVYCEKCEWQPVEERQLPVELPQVEKYQPTDTGESPLAVMTDWVNTTCPNCGGVARRETDTMPNWAGSSWYFLRYIDPHNDSLLASPEKLKHWLMVDWYNGGMEHTTLHLLYSRFWHKFLYDIGVVPTPEPYAKRTSHGVVLGPDGRKMSKSKGNVINPAEVVDKYGADTLRLYEMFSGPFSQMVAWSWESVEGAFRYLRRVWNIVGETEQKSQSSAVALSLFGKVVEKVAGDIEEMKFNTAVAALMEYLNWWTDHKSEVGHDIAMDYLKVLAPMAPFMTEELWQRAGNTESIHVQAWPTVAITDIPDMKTVVVVQVNGKVRAKVELEAKDAQNQQLVEVTAKAHENVMKFIGEGNPRVVFVPGKLINFILN